MGICLVTTLKEAISDSDLLKLGEVRFRAKKNINAPFDIGFICNSEATITVKSPGYITDSTGASNLGTSKTISPGTFTRTYFSAGDYDIIISNEYGITQISFDHNANNLVVDVDDFVMSQNAQIFRTSSNNTIGSLESFKKYPSMVQLQVYKISNDDKAAGITGDLEDVKDLPLQILTLRYQKKVTGDIANLSSMTDMNRLVLGYTGIRGNISSLASMGSLIQVELINDNAITGNVGVFAGKTAMQECTLQDTSVDGNLSSFTGCTALQSLNVSNTAVTGDTSDLADLTNLTTFTYTNTAITGTWPLV